MRTKATMALAAALAAAALGAGTAHAAAPEIEVLSNRADLISAGDALVRIALPSGADPAGLEVTLDGRDVSDAFAPRPNGHVEGLVEGLALGENVLRATVAGESAEATIVNHPNGGPVFSGPQVQPWVCQASAVDEQCNQPVSYAFLYKPAAGSGFQPYDPANPPPDEQIATTTTDEGHTVPYVVREETGYQNRDQYRIAVLYDPERPWAPWAPQPAWNRKLLITHGASCGIDRRAGSAPDVRNDAALSRGFAVMSTALNNAGHNCNLVTQAESLVMAKERVVERYGPIRYTIGTGCSGGSLTQQQVANAYPGIYQGILPACSFPDAWSTGQQLVDYHLTRLYLEDPSRWGPGVVWTPREIAAVDGHPNHVNSIVLDTLYWTSLGNPTSGCAGVSDEQLYHPERNPDGVRCTLADYMINVFGHRPEEVWIEPERRIGRGFAGLPLDNVGVQYGLRALERGEISPEQFVDLNEKIGGGDIDVNPTPERLRADRPALANSYRSGAVNDGSHLDEVAIIDLRGPDHGAFHDAYRSWATRARIEREHGHFENHVIWVGHVPLVGDPSYTTEGLVAMDRWLAAVERDGSDRPLAERIVDNRPAELRDRCSQIPAVELVALPGAGQVCRLKDVESRYGTPRTVAGEGIETDNNKCALKPLRRQDYYPVQFTGDQWSRLERAFPTGVCDWSEPPVDGAGDTVPWQTYQEADGSVIFGGRSLGAAPAGSGGGWTSAAFAGWRAAE